MRFRPRPLAVLALAGLLATAGCDTASTPTAAAPEQTSAAARTPESTTVTKANTPAAPKILYPGHGSRHWAEAPGQSGGPDGHAGRLFTYRVLVEKDIHNLSPTTFADAVRTTLAAPQGWTSGGRWRFRRVGPGQPYDFTLYLATPDTRDVLCHSTSRDGYTSCRWDDSVVLNVARWVKGIPAFHGNVALYRNYMVNHEVGHQLGMGHMLCPGPGKPAPVMQQQTLGMHGCVPNAWPYPDRGNEFYATRSGAYDDPQPPADTGDE